MRVPLLLLALFVPAALAAEDPCASGGGVKLADGCGGYEGSCCSLDRATRYWCVTYGSNGEQKAACMAPCGGASCGWKCDRNPLTDLCITYPVSLGSYQCGQALGACSALNRNALETPVATSTPAVEPVENTTDRLLGLLPGGGPPDPQTEPDSAMRYGLLAPDPTAENPWTCTALCSPQCGGKNCGPDGCGAAGQQGVCGQCNSDPTSQCPMACGANGKCDKVCADCAALGWTCGSNCCGGVCGSCTPPATCGSETHTCIGGVVDDAPEVVDTVGDPGGGSDPGSGVDPGGGSDPGGSPDPGSSDPGQPPADGAPEAAPAEAGSDSGVSADGGCPDGSSLVSGICLKDPPKQTPRDDTGGGGCQAGGVGCSSSALVVLAGLVAIRRRRGFGARG